MSGIMADQPKKYPQILAKRVGGERATIQVKTQTIQQSSGCVEIKYWI